MDREIAYWLKGNISGAHKHLEALLPLLKLHKVEGAGENIAEALYAINRISAAIEKRIAAQPSPGGETGR